MTLFAGQVLRVDQTTGEASATYLTVADSDTTMASLDAGTIYNLCGINMAAPPPLDLRQISGTLLDGSAYSVTVVHFSARGKDFYVVPATFAPEAVASVTTSAPAGPLTPFDYFSHGLTVDDEPLLAGQALAVRFNGAGGAVQTGVVDALVTDDDGLIHTSSEPGVGAQIMFGPAFDTPLDFHTLDLANRQMVLVKVFYHGTTSDGSFTALRISEPSGNGTQVWYIPKGNVDLANVVSFQRERLLNASADGLSYGVFGLTQDRSLHLGGAAADYLQGTVLHDDLIGNGGDDSLIGGLGADRLEGGAGNDVLHGGAQNDTMVGGAGNDNLFGGNDDDSLFGKDGNDTMQANWGDDSLYGGNGNDRLGAGSDDDFVSGGAGNDSLIGFDGNDVLNDGTGVDTLNGGDGADVFVLVTDGATDRIFDYQDGLDRIDLAVAFDLLIITTLSAGHVQIIHSGEVLLLDDLTRTLTAADLTAADFL